MKKRSFVEHITSFISNMRVERVESEEGGESPEFLSMLEELRNKIEGFVLWRENIDTYDFSLSMAFAKELLESGRIKTPFIYDEDLTSGEQEEFLDCFPISFKLKDMIINNKDVDAGWVGDINFDLTHKDRTMPIVKVGVNEEPYAYDIVGDVYLVEEGIKLTGSNAVLALMKKFQSYSYSFVGEFTFKGHTIEFPCRYEHQGE